MTMKTVVNWAGDLTFVGHGDRNKAGVVMDAGEAAGGLGIGASPMELLLMGAGGCASIDIVMILKKARQELTGCEVTVTGERREEVPKKFTDIHLHFKITGKDLKEAQVERGVNLSLEKYCSVSATLAGEAKITWGWEVAET